MIDVREQSSFSKNTSPLGSQVYTRLEPCGQEIIYFCHDIDPSLLLLHLSGVGKGLLDAYESSSKTGPNRLERSMQVCKHCFVRVLTSWECIRRRPSWRSSSPTASCYPSDTSSRRCRWPAFEPAARWAPQAARRFAQDCRGRCKCR